MAQRKKKTSGSKSKAVTTSWQTALQKHAKEGKAPKEKASTSNVISIKGGKFTLGGTKIGLNGKGQELDCIIIGWAFEKSYYDSEYKEGEASCPACFAIGYDEDELEPHKDAPSPQSSACEGCELNEWGSGRGDGKACSDRRRLVVAFEGKDGKVDLKLLNIPPTSIKNWKSYVHDIEAMGLHTLQCATRIMFDEDSTATMPPLVFEFVNEIKNQKQLDILASTLEAAEEMLERPYDPKNYSTGSKKKGKKKAKKKAKKKTAARRSKFS